MHTVDDALDLLSRLGAPARLVTHHRLVAEAAELLLDGLARLPGRGPAVDRRRVLLGAALHDAGKILHPGEMSGPGSQHEPDGEALLLAQGVEPSLARCCRTHAAWSGPDAGLEDRLVALADTLWKGKRLPALEEAVRGEMAQRRGLDPWALFVPLDDLCERIAAKGPERLERSVAG